MSPEVSPRLNDTKHYVISNYKGLVPTLISQQQEEIKS